MKLLLAVLFVAGITGAGAGAVVCGRIARWWRINAISDAIVALGSTANSAAFAVVASAFSATVGLSTAAARVSTAIGTTAFAAASSSSGPTTASTTFAAAYGAAPAATLATS